MKPHEALGALLRQQDELIRLLQEMDKQQQKSDKEGDREIAWFWWRGDIEKALGYGPEELFPDLEDE